MIWRPDPSKPQGLTAFAGLLVNTSGRALIQNYFELGLVQHGTFPSRPNDLAGLLFLNFMYNPRATGAVNDRIAAAGLFGNVSNVSQIVELNYGFEVAPGVQIKPYTDFTFHPDQNLFNVPVPNPKVHYAWAVGAQLSVLLNPLLGLPSFFRANRIRPTVSTRHRRPNSDSIAPANFALEIGCSHPVICRPGVGAPMSGREIRSTTRAATGRPAQKQAAVRTGNVQSLTRALSIIKTIGSEGDGATLTDIARTTKLAPSTAHRLLTTLQQARFCPVRGGGRPMVHRDRSLRGGKRVSANARYRAGGAPVPPPPDGAEW